MFEDMHLVYAGSRGCRRGARLRVIMLSMMRFATRRHGPIRWPHCVDAAHARVEPEPGRPCVTACRCRSRSIQAFSTTSPARRRERRRRVHAGGGRDARRPCRQPRAAARDRRQDARARDGRSEGRRRICSMRCRARDSSRPASPACRSRSTWSGWWRTRPSAATAAVASEHRRATGQEAARRHRSAEPSTPPGPSRRRLRLSSARLRTSDAT